MSARPGATYRHTQRGRLHWLLDAIGTLMMALAIVFAESPPGWPYFVAMGTIFLVIGSAFRTLTVEDRGEDLAIRFGPLPLFRTRVPYRDMRSADVGRTTILDGWGIHLSLRGGVVWNLWGRDCVVIRRRRGTLRVGTDDAANLAEFLSARIEDPGTDPVGAGR